MKKFIALLLALIMAFSVTSVAFAAGRSTVSSEEATPPQRTFGNLEMTEGEIVDFVMNLPAGSAFQGAKLTLKLAKFAVKIALALDRIHLIDLSPLKNAILEWVANLIEDAVRDQRPEVPAEVAQIVELYNNAIAKAKVTGNMTVRKTDDAQIELTDCSVATIKSVVNTIAQKFVSGTTQEKWKFSGGKGKNAAGDTTTPDRLIPPADRAAALLGAYVASATVSEDGHNFTLTLERELSTFDGEYTVYPVGNSSVIDPINLAELDISPAMIKEAEMIYTGTVIKAVVDDDGRLTKLRITVPVTVSAVGSLKDFTSIATGFDVVLEDTYTFTY